MTGVVYCQDAKDLLDAFAETIRELVKFHEEQFQAVIGGDLDSARFDDLIHLANERKSQAKYVISPTSGDSPMLHYLGRRGLGFYPRNVFANPVGRQVPVNPEWS